MPLTTCRECGKTISGEAPSCPHCGALDPTRGVAARTQRGADQRKIFIIVTLVFGTLFLAVVARNGTPESADAGESPAVLQAREDRELEYQAEEAVRGTLRDPKSAEFQSVTVVRKAGSIAVCGSVNAKNGFGGYTGFQPFMSRGGVAMIRQSESSTQFLSLWNRACVTP